MRKSEVFENFIKIAQEKGLTSSEKSYKTLEEKSRADSLSAEDISKLYYLRPNTNKDMGYKNNIMEIAHKSPVVVSPAHDRLNGLVENNIERQNILLHIVNKRNDGLLTQRKYAQKDLMLSLVRIANDLDNQNKDELRILADACLEEAQMIKSGWVVFALSGAAVIGAIYAWQHMDAPNRGYTKNYSAIVKEITDLSKSSITLGVGMEIEKSFRDTLQAFLEHLDDFDKKFNKYKPLIQLIQEPKTNEELKQIADSRVGTEVVKAYKDIRESGENLYPYLDMVKRNFQSDFYKGMQIKEKGAITQFIDDLGIFHGGKTGLVSDDFGDVVNAIPAFLQSIHDILEVLGKSESIALAAQRNLQSATTGSSQTFGPVATFENVPGAGAPSAPQFGPLGTTQPNVPMPLPTVPEGAAAPGGAAQQGLATTTPQVPRAIPMTSSNPGGLQFLNNITGGLFAR